MIKPTSVLMQEAMDATVAANLAEADKPQFYGEYLAHLVAQQCARLPDQQSRLGWNDDRKAQARVDAELIRQQFERPVAPVAASRMNDNLRRVMIGAGYAAPELATRAHRLVELVVREMVSVARTGMCWRGTPEDRQLSEEMYDWFGLPSEKLRNTQ